ncbi:hypothetical protein M9H77_18546 [Catharanthus roseus]|uniref:Uncharacterized protein n=1 Tax=Catharanthus roseus TaxID=4058 RepID=A0ACC0B809_CATRO|nr:hypothetical protein M9H77_18546 [Catharanthus roseus]
MGLGEQIDDLIESNTVRLLDWNNAMTDIQLVRFRSDRFGWAENIELLKAEVTNGQQNVTITVTLIITHGTHALYRYIKINIEMSLKFILRLISHLVSKDPEIPVSNIIQEMQVLLQTSYIYLRETYRRIYQSNFYLVGHEDFWRDAPYNLTFHPPNMNNGRGRKQGTRFRGEMDYKNPDSAPRCSRCRMQGYNRKNFNNPIQAIYKFLFLKLL